jgi:MYXO-CTERM domain-containing protein
MKSLTTLARSLAVALPMMFAFDNVMASMTEAMPGPGIFGLVALGVVGALAVARSRR